MKVAGDFVLVINPASPAIVSLMIMIMKRNDNEEELMACILQLRASLASKSAENRKINCYCTRSWSR